MAQKDQEFATYRKFNDEGAVTELTDELRNGGIEYQIINNSSQFDASFGNDELTKEFSVKLRKEDFEKAEQIVRKNAIKLIDQIDSSYYLYSFSDEELMEVITQPFDWSTIDYVLAEKLLRERGKPVD